MELERIVPLIGISIGITLLIVLWVGIALWLFGNANRYGLVGWMWAFIGIASGPFGLIVYLVVRHMLHPIDRSIPQPPAAADDPLPPPIAIEPETPNTAANERL